MSNTSINAIRTPLCDLLGCDVPILLEGMGGDARWELAARAHVDAMVTDAVACLARSSSEGLQ